MKTMLQFLVVGGVCGALIFTQGVNAADVLKLTEVMYDPAGTDTKHEWIEIYNAGSVAVPLSSIRFLESGVAHKITPYGNASPLLEPGHYILIADDAATILQDLQHVPDITEKVYDSAFSLVNTGEELAITSSGGEVYDTFTYDVTMGASSNGNSLQKTEQGTIIPAVPTPTAANAQVAVTETVPTATSSTPVSDSTSTHGNQAAVSTYEIKSLLDITIGRERLVSIHQPITFSGLIEPAGRRKVRWNFGDGTVGSGRVQTHTYTAPGTYVVNASVLSGQQRAFDRAKVTVVKPSLSFGQAGEGLGITNTGTHEINMGDWRITQQLQGTSSSTPGRNKWRIPEDTLILAGSTLPLSPHLQTLKPDTVCKHYTLYYPDNTRYATFDCPTTTNEVQ